MHRLANESRRRFRRAESSRRLSEKDPKTELEFEKNEPESKSFLRDPETELEPKNFLKDPKTELEFLKALKWVESIDESETEMESPDAPKADSECDNYADVGLEGFGGIVISEFLRSLGSTGDSSEDAEPKGRRAGYNKKIRRRNTMRRAMERATQTIRLRRSEKAVQTEE